MSEPEPEILLPAAYELAQVGDVLQVSDEQPIPEDWRVMDGSRLISYEWPEFVAKLHIAGGMFTLPAPQRSIEGHHWIIKLGEHRKLPTPPADVERVFRRG